MSSLVSASYLSISLGDRLKDEYCRDLGVVVGEHCFVKFSLLSNCTTAEEISYSLGKSQPTVKAVKNTCFSNNSARMKNNNGHNATGPLTVL